MHDINCKIRIEEVFNFILTWLVLFFFFPHVFFFLMLGNKGHYL